MLNFSQRLTSLKNVAYKRCLKSRPACTSLPRAYGIRLNHSLNVIFLRHGWFGSNGFSSLKLEDFFIPRDQNENFCIPRALGKMIVHRFTCTMPTSTPIRCTNGQRNRNPWLENEVVGYGHTDESV